MECRLNEQCANEYTDEQDVHKMITVIKLVEGKNSVGVTRMLTRDLFAVANVLVGRI